MLNLTESEAVEIKAQAGIFNVILMFLTGHLHLVAVFFSYIKGKHRR